MRLAVLILSFTALPALAADYPTRSSDTLFSQAELLERVAGKSLTYYDKGRSDYATDGRYAYTYDGGNSSEGQYEVTDDSTICVTFDNGFSRCDLYVQNGARLVMVTQDGMRFPIRSES